MEKGYWAIYENSLSGVLERKFAKTLREAGYIIRAWAMKAFMGGTFCSGDILKIEEGESEE